MSKANMRYKSDYVTIKVVGNVISIDAQSWRSKKWAVKQLKAEAEKVGIELVEAEGKFFVSNKDISTVEKQLIPALRKCNN